MRGQAAYFLVAEALYGVVPVFVAFAETVYGAHKFDARYRVSPLARPWALQSALLHLVFYARFLYAPRGRGAGDAAPPAADAHAPRTAGFARRARRRARSRPRSRPSSPRSPAPSSSAAATSPSSSS